MALVTVTKCHGTGNDFVLLDARNLTGVAYSSLAQEVCHRRFSIGADGLLVLERPSTPGCDARMRIFNADGSEAQMCGNGIRCVTLMLHGERPGKTTYSFDTLSGVVQTEIIASGEHQAVRVSMGIPKVATRAYSTVGVNSYYVSMGNPHAVIFTSSDLEHMDLEQMARAINESEPDGINVEIANVVPDGIQMRVHERGVGETWACGTGACAVGAAAISSGRATSPVRVRSKGGAVEVDWAGEGEPAFLTGDAHLVYRANIEISAGRATPVSAL